jgi:membrane-associated PAP2 superfamily phosphatase
VHLFAERPNGLPRARCFPGGHSSSGFALFGLYFLCLKRSRRQALAALALAITIGGLFALGQEARGAHFLSHDIWSAAIVWFACLGVFSLGYRGQVWATGCSPCTVDAMPDATT